MTGTNIINEIASGLKNSRASQTSGVSIRFGGVSGEGLLSSYSLNLAPYSPAQCSVNFELFGSGQNIPVSGELKSQTVSRSSDVQALASNVGHSAFSSFMAITSMFGGKVTVDNFQTRTITETEVGEGDVRFQK